MTVYSVLERRPVRSLYLLGTVPKAVQDAARNGRPAARLLDPKNPTRWPSTEWGAADHKALAKFSDPNWRSARTPDVEFVQEQAVGAVRVGGSEDLDFGDLRTLNRLDEDGAVIFRS